METHNNLTINQFRTLLKKCNGKRVAIDTETTGLYWWKNKLITVGFHCPDAGIEGCIDLGVEATDFNIPEQQKFQEDVQRVISETLLAGTTVILHNTKFDLGFMGVPSDGDNACYGWKLVDTAVMIHLMDSRNRKGMEAAEKQLLGSNSKRDHIEKAPDNKKIKNKVWLWPANVRQDYCINDCRVTYQFAEAIGPLLRKEGLDKVFQKDMRYIKYVYHIEKRGIALDQEFVGRATLALTAHKMNLEQQLYDAVGYEFNWRSNVQLSNAIYANLGIPMPINPFADADGVDRSRFADKGQYNKTMTSTFILMEKAKHPLGELISSLRESAKLVKTLNKWLELVDDNSVIHSNFNLTGTRTGRLSSSKPNLANVPSEVRSRFTQGLFSGGTTRSEEYNLRNAFVARPGYSILSVDYKQMEMRMFGILSQDPFMLKSLAAGADVHADIAEKVWGVRDDVHREWSKTISFGLIYGMTTGSLQHKLGMTRQEAQRVTDEYWAEFPRIRPWLFETVGQCRKNGYLRYWSGRVWREENEMFMYKGANAIIQGGCADLLSIAAMRVADWIKQQGKDYGGIVNLVYDEICSEVPTEDIHRAAKEVGAIMQVPDLFSIPFLTDAKAGPSYGSLEKLKSS